MEYSTAIKDLVKKIKSSISRDTYRTDKYCNEVLIDIVESMEPLLRNQVEKTKLLSKDQLEIANKLQKYVDKYIKETLYEDIQSYFGIIRDHFRFSNFEDYTVEEMGSFKKELGELLEKYIYSHKKDDE